MYAAKEEMNLEHGYTDRSTVKAFQSLHEAQAFMEGKLLKTINTSGDQKFYAVQNGKVPGVYTDWTEAQAQIRGVKKPKHKKFNTRAEAEAFVAAGKKTNGSDASQLISPEEEIRRLIVRNSAPGLQLNGTYAPTDKDGNPYDVGRGPLPPGAEDGFDPNIKLSTDGTIINRTEEEKNKTKLVPKEQEPAGMLRIYTDGSSLRNGQAGARAGVGVYFGPLDPKYDDSPLSTSTSTSTSSFSDHHVYYIDWAARARGAYDNGGATPSSNDHNSKKRRNDGMSSQDEDELDEAEEQEEEKLTNWRYRNVSEALKGSKQTNQRAELTAISRALDIAPRHRDVTIYTDSKYSIECVTNWYRKWEKNGYVNSQRKAVENKDLVEDIRKKIDEREFLKKKTLFVWVKGHANDPGNIAADKLAVAGSLSNRVANDDDGYEGDGQMNDQTDEEGGESTTLEVQDGDVEILDEETRAAFKAMDEAIADDSEEDFK